jgi:hypothetical protein
MHRKGRGWKSNRQKGECPSQFTNSLPPFRVYLQALSSPTPQYSTYISEHAQWCQLGVSRQRVGHHLSCPQYPSLPLLQTRAASCSQATEGSCAILLTRGRATTTTHMQVLPIPRTDIGRLLTVKSQGATCHPWKDTNAICCHCKSYWYWCSLYLVYSLVVVSQILLGLPYPRAQPKELQ